MSEKIKDVLWIIVGLSLILFMFYLVVTDYTENECPVCVQRDCVIPECPSCNVTCPACPSINLSSLINFSPRSVVQEELGVVMEASPESFIFDSECSGTSYAVYLYDPIERLCRRSIDDSVRIGFSPEQCCLLGGPSVSCITLGNSSFSSGYGRWKALGCYK